MKAVRQCSATQQPKCAHFRRAYITPRLGSVGAKSGGHGATKCVQAKALARAVPGQKDMTAELLERVFRVAVSSRLKQHGDIDVDVRSTAWGLLEGRFGGMTVRGRHWRTPLELTAEQLMVDVGELLLDYNKLVWQQTVCLKNVPQGSVSFTLSSADLANFMVHPIMVAAASRAIKGQAFLFDRTTACVRMEPGTGRGVVTYQGVWAGDGRRYAVTMSTPPAAPSAGSSRPGGPPATAAAAASMEQLIVTARRVPEPQAPGAGAAQRSTTGSYASAGSVDESSTAAMVAAAAAAAARLDADASAGAPAAEGEGECDADLGAAVVAEGLHRFFSSLMLNLQGIELRQPTLMVQLPAAGARGSPAPRQGGAQPGAAELLPALLTLTMKVSIVQLPPVDMKF